ncbi:MAG: DUF354 domain-containing protein [Candidatus Binatia bacterium]
MKILLDILHPAHVHFFRNAITELRRQGCEVIVTARDKDLTLRLLNLYGIGYDCISREASSKKGLAWELLSRNVKLAQIVRREKPQVMASIGGISTAQVGFLTRTRNLIFYDTENAWVSNLLSYPLATAVVTPECYQGSVFGRHVTYPGYHELAYLHPRRFTPDPQVLTSAGISPQSIFSVVRFVSWQALHDLHAAGFPLDAKRQLICALEEFGQVFITSEQQLPPEFQHLCFSLPPDQIHHFLAFAHLYVGESATMASESAMLGVPAIYLDRYGRGYTDELERRYGLCHTYSSTQAERAIEKSREMLSLNIKHQSDFKSRVATMLSEKIDVTAWIIKMLTTFSKA